jgi:uncharacterized protein YegP (UPF0339 family)
MLITLSQLFNHCFTIKIILYVIFNSIIKNRIYHIKFIIEKMGKFVVKTRKDGEFQFNLKAGNGQVILSSEGYKTKANCLNGVESVKRNAQDNDKFDRKTSTNGKHYFGLKATNGQVIGTSEMYESASGMENGIESVKSNAPDATIEDLD